MIQVGSQLQPTTNLKLTLNLIQTQKKLAHFHLDDLSRPKMIIAPPTPGNFLVPIIDWSTLRH